MTTLTPKQEAFCLVYIETGNASEAYRQSYSVQNMKPETVNRNAKAQLDNSKIAARINALQERHQKRHNVTVDSLIAELEEARQIAIKEAQPSAAVSATMGKAKIVGVDIQKVEHSGTLTHHHTLEFIGDD